MGPERQREKGTGPGCQRGRGGEGACAAGLVAGLRGGQLGHVSGPGEEEEEALTGGVTLAGLRPGSRELCPLFLFIFLFQFFFQKSF